MIARLYQKTDSCIRQFVEHLFCGIVLCTIVIVLYHIAKMNDSFDIQIIGCADQLIDGSVHDIFFEFHGILCIRKQNKVVIFFVFQLICFVASIVSRISGRIRDQPVFLFQCRVGDTDLLQISLEKFVQFFIAPVSFFLHIPRRTDAESSVLFIGKHTDHIAALIITECFASIYISADLLTVRNNRNMIPFISFIHRHRRCRTLHLMIIFCRSRKELYLFTV